MTGDGKSLSLAALVLAALIAIAFIRGCTDVLVSSRQARAIQFCIDNAMEWRGGDCVARARPPQADSAGTNP